MMPSAAEFVDSLQGAGRYTFTDAEVSEALGVSDLGVDAALRRLKRKGRIAVPRRGFYVIVPTEYATQGAPPASWYIDTLMVHLGQAYYVGLLSAAAIHGAAHQQPMVFHVVTDRPTRAVHTGRSRIALHVRSDVASADTIRVQTETGYMRVSSPETTALDLVQFTRAGGGIGNVATVLDELAERLTPPDLMAAARERKTPTLQRLGYLLGILGHVELADALERTLADRRVRPVLLVPHRGENALAASADARWRVVPNEPVEVDE